jgi:uncharacterized HAD superfamily protein
MFKYIRGNSLKQVLAIDYDDCIYPFTIEFTKFLNKKLGVNKTLKDCIVYELGIVYNISVEEVINNIKLFMDTRAAKNALPIPGAKTVVKELSKYYDIHIVTARPEKLHIETKSWLDKDFKGLYSNIEYCSFYSIDKKEIRKSKSDVLKEINAKCFIDDNVYNVTECHKAGFFSLLFGSYAWQSSVEKDIITASNWAEIRQMLIGEKSIIWQDF